MKKKHEKKSPSMTWVGLVGLRPDSWEGIKRSESVISQNIKAEGFY